MDITEALLTLDQNNNDHWTAGGLPDVKTISVLVGNENLKRADINAVDSDFIRQDNVTASTNHEQKPLDPETELSKELSKYQAKMGILTKEKADLEKTIKILGRDIGVLAGRLDRVRSNRQNTDVQDYLITQGKLRAEKAERLKAMNPNAIKEILGSVAKAPIDQVMNIRKSSRGSKRPNTSMMN